MKNRENKKEARRMRRRLKGTTRDGERAAENAERGRGAQYEREIDNALERESARRAKAVAATAMFVILLTVATSVASLTRTMFELHEYAGYLTLISLSVLTLIFVIRPLLAIFALKPLHISVDSEMAPEASRKNVAVMKRSARNIIEYHSRERNVPYLSEERVQALREALDAPKAEFVALMGDIYRNEIRQRTSEIIRASALRSFLATAISQNDKLDFLATMTVNLSVTKQIVFTYGFRPTAASMLKIYLSALKSSLMAFCLENVSLFSGISNKLLKSATEWIPLLNVVVDSACQGATNALMTSLMGRKVRRLLYGEFNTAVDMDGDGIDDDVQDAINEVKGLEDEVSAERGK